MRHGWLVLATACGSVSSSSPGNDAGSMTDAAPSDASPSDASPTDAAAPTPGELRWVRSLDAMGGLGIAMTSSSVVVTGELSAPANLGGEALVPAGGSDFAIVGYQASDASYLYAQRYGSTGNETGFLSNADPMGLPYVYGFGDGASIDLGQGAFASAADDGFVGLYGVSAPMWVAHLTGPGAEQFTATAPGPGDTIFAAGYFEASAMLNSAALTNHGGRDFVIAQFDDFATGTGTAKAVATYGGPGRDQVSAMAFDGTSLIVGGFFDSTIDFGGTTHVLTSKGNNDCFIVKLGSDGKGVWATQFGAADDDRTIGVAVDPSGDVYITGQFHDTIMVGGFSLASVGGFDGFVAKLRGSDGSVVWAESLGTAADDFIGALAVDAAGHGITAITLAGALPGTVSAGGLDGLVAGFNTADGSQRWHLAVSTAGDDRGGAVGYGPDGDAYALIALGGAFDFGVSIVGPPAPASVLVKLSP